MKSVYGKIWQQKQLDESYIDELRRRLIVSDLLARLLSLRTSNLEDATKFLSPKIRDSLPDPFHLLDMRKAVDRVMLAITKQQKICVFADYDVDGATSAALLKTFFHELGIVITIYVPDRITEGYGPTAAAMQKIRNLSIDLVITVDCGTVAFEAVEYANHIGLEVIIIDHHISAETIPAAVAVVNPNRFDETSKYTYLAAVGVSFLFIVALTTVLTKSNYALDKPIPHPLQFLDLVALGTVCDVMPLTNLNRAFIAQGLKVMMQRRNLGIRILCDIIELEEKPSCYHLGFLIGPRINAGGRVGRASLGAELLSTKSEHEAVILARELDLHNRERKTIEAFMLEKATALAGSQQDNELIFVVGEGWHVGVIGIIASRLKDKFNKPTIVVALNDGVGKASCRSTEYINLGNAIADAKNNGLIVHGGGHAAAGGFTAKEEQLTKLRQFFVQKFRQESVNLIEYDIMEYDAELTLSSINPALIEEIEKLAPFGHDNPEPLFKFSNLFVLKSQPVGQKHISCLLSATRNSYASGIIRAIAFNSLATPIATSLLFNKQPSISVIGFLKLNFWQNTQTIQLQIKDIIVE